MRFSLFVSLWIVSLACWSSSSSSPREGACRRQKDEFQTMGDPLTPTEEVEELIKELALAPPSRVHEGGNNSNSATPESIALRLPMPILPTPQPLRLGLPMLEDEFQTMVDPMTTETEEIEELLKELTLAPLTETEEVEELIKELTLAPPSRVHEGGSNSSSATPESFRRRLPMPSPPILPIPQPLPPGLSMLYPPIPLGHVRGPWPFLYFMPPPLLCFMPWQRPLPWQHLPMAGLHLPYVFGRAPSPLLVFLPIHAPFLPCFPWPGPGSL